MDFYQEIKKQSKKQYKSIFAKIAENTGVTEKYVRMILNGKRNGTKHKNAKGNQIIELAKQFIKE